MSGDLFGMMLPWVTAAAVDAYAGLGNWPRPRPWQFAVEILLLLFAGRSQWKLARGWLRTPLLAPTVMLFFAVVPHVPTGRLQMVLFVVGLVTAVYLFLRYGASRLPASPWLGALLAVVVVVGTRYADAMSSDHPHLTAARSTFDSFTWPLRLGQVPQSTSAGPPLVVISVDTLRADSAQTMQTVKRLQARGASWERAMSASNWTLPAVASLQTGKLPAEHGAGCFAGGHCQGIFDEVPVVAEQLAAAGYATAAVVTNPWITVGTGFERGFQSFTESGNFFSRLLIGGPPLEHHRQDAAFVVDAALSWLAKAPERGFYLWVHVLDPHLPYRHWPDKKFHELRVDQFRNALPYPEEERPTLRAAYENEVAYTDAQLVRLLDALEARGVLDEGVVVLTADHGEEFWEHGGFEHGHTHHGEVVDIPLVLVAPGVAPGVRTGVASIIDVAPTLRAVAGLPADGIDLRQGVPADRIAPAWGGVVMHIDCSARGAGRRAIVRDCSKSLDAAQTFDLTADIGEHKPLPADAGDQVVQAARAVTPPRKGAAGNYDREALRMLGYQQ